MSAANRRCSNPDHPPHSPCVVCDNDYSSRYVCAGCRADEANTDWTERSRLEVLAGEIDEPLTDWRSVEVQCRPELERQIIDCMALRTIHAPRRVRLRFDGQRYWTWEWDSRSLTFDEVAHLLACSKQYVEKVYRRAVKA